jgi:hypothetical protein
VATMGKKEKSFVFSSPKPKQEYSTFDANISSNSEPI